MTVDEIVRNIALLGSGLDKPTLEDNAIFLKYINLAHLELSRKTLLCNPKLTRTNEVKNCVNGVVEPLDNDPFMVTNVYLVSQNVNLDPILVENVLSRDPGITEVGVPSYWYYFNNAINTFPRFTGTVGVWYGNQPIVITKNTLESEIPYPYTYHSVLIDGACYYLFQGESGFKDAGKMNESMARWKLGMTQLLSHLNAFSGKNIASTFSPV